MLGYLQCWHSESLLLFSQFHISPRPKGQTVRTMDPVSQERQCAQEITEAQRFRTRALASQLLQMPSGGLEKLLTFLSCNMGLRKPTSQMLRMLSGQWLLSLYPQLHV